MLLKTGVAVMTVALFFVLVGVFVVLRDGAETAVAAQAEEVSASAPLARTYPPEISREAGASSQQEAEPGGPRQAAQPLRGEGTNWPMPTEEQLKKASELRSYDLPAGAIMGLTIDSIGLKNAPVFDYESNWALDNGVAREPETSLPWSRTKERNVYLVGHRLGWPGTGSRLIFYHLDKLARGDEILLRDRNGGSYRYRVSETFVVDPGDTWVMGQVRGRDMVTLQTCTPIPTFEKRLIVRADRV